MAEQIDLEAVLARLAGELAWPETPDMRSRVRRALPVRRAWFESRWALAAVAVVAIIALLVAYTPTRTAIADWVNLHTRITRTNSLPTPSPPPAGTIGSRLGLGGATTLPGAQRAVHWPVLVPSALGAPDEVYLQNPPNGPSLGEVTLVYGPRPGIPVSGSTGAGVLVTEARGQVNQDFFGKVVGQGTTVVPVTVGAGQGWWISGSPHEFFFVDADGSTRAETLRLATNTLILDVGGTVLRIEGDLTEQQALAIAASLH